MGPVKTLVKLETKINHSLKWLMIIVVILLMGINAYAVWPRLLYQGGVLRLQVKDYQGAEQYFFRALKWMPTSLSRLCYGSDLFRIHLGAGQALYEEGVGIWRASGLTSEVMEILQRGKQHLTTARHREPKDYITAYWLARTEAALETAYDVLYPEKENPHQASGYFMEAMNLRPSGGAIRYLYARYLYGKGQMDAVPEIVQKILELSPRFYKQLREEPFFNSAMYASAEDGLHRALRYRFALKDAQRALSELSLDMGKYETALQFFEAAVAGDPLSDEDLARMGILLVASGNKEKGFDLFDQVLGFSGVKDRTIDMIYDYFDGAGQFDLFLEYSFHARKEGLRSAVLEINVAKGLIKQGLLPFARARLVQLNAHHEDARAYHLLAQLSEAEGDWERMAQMTISGIALAPRNAGLHYMLSRAYERLGELGPARREAMEAIRLEPDIKQYRIQGQRLEKYRE